MVLELTDGAYPLLEYVKVTEECEEAFKNVDLVIFLAG